MIMMMIYDQCWSCWPLTNCCVFDFEDLNECESGNNTCTTAQVCFNFQGGYTCLDPLICEPPYIELSDKWVTQSLNPVHNNHIGPVENIIITPCLSICVSSVSVCVRQRTPPVENGLSLFCTATWTCPLGAASLLIFFRCRPPRATPGLSTSSRSNLATRAVSFTCGWVELEVMWQLTKSTVKWSTNCEGGTHNISTEVFHRPRKSLNQTNSAPKLQTEENRVHDIKS